MPVVEHWFDFICPFCYIAQDRNAVLRWAGVEVTELPLIIHPEIGPGGQAAPDRRGPMYAHLRTEAKNAGLELTWSDRIPYSRPALVRAEIVRLAQPDRHADFCRLVFDAYFGRGLDIEQADVLAGCAEQAGVSAESFADPEMAVRGEQGITASAARAAGVGVSGTPAWLVRDELIVGLRSHRDFQAIARMLTA